MLIMNISGAKILKLYCADIEFDAKFKSNNVLFTHYKNFMKLIRLFFSVNVIILPLTL